VKFVSKFLKISYKLKMSIIVDTVEADIQRMDATDVGIIVGVVLILAGIIWFIVRRKRVAPQQHAITPQQFHSPPPQPAASAAMTAPASQAAPVIKRDPKNAAYLQEIKGYGDELVEAVAKMVNILLIAPFHAPLVDLHEARASLEKRGVEGMDWTKQYIQTLLTLDISSPRTEFMKACDSAGEMCIGLLDDGMEMTFKAVSNEHQVLRPNFVLPIDKQHEQKSRISNNLKSPFAEILHSVAKAQSLQGWLNANHGAFLSHASSDTDWGWVAKNLGGGALVAINPFIGVPMLAATWFGESKKDKQKNEFIQHYCTQADEMVNTLAALLDPVEKAGSQAAAYWKEKTRESSIASLLYVCSTLDNNGASLKGVASAWRKDTKDTNKQAEKIHKDFYGE
jgi:hypothetical protein